MCNYKAYERLLSSWHDKYPSKEIQERFFKDGVVGEAEQLAVAFDTFHKQPRRLLFVLREPNAQGAQQANLDLRTIFSVSSTKLTHSTLALWASVILKIGRKLDDRPNGKDTADILRKVAIINLKKIGAGGVAEKVPLCIHAWEFRDFLKRQIECLSPTVIITGGLDVNDLLWFITKGYGTSPPGRHWTFNTEAQVYACYHPARRCSADDALTDMKKAMDAKTTRNG